MQLELVRIQIRIRNTADVQFTLSPKRLTDSLIMTIAGSRYHAFLADYSPERLTLSPHYLRRLNVDLLVHRFHRNASGCSIADDFAALSSLSTP